jgi:GntR family transcriptional repressor for pyruvate dehydrogenase complex
MLEPDAGASQYRAPRVAELVASDLRDRILSGELEDDAELPRQEDLLKELKVSPPSLREACRILETEGLITVRRGVRGGATVHRLKASTAAYMLAMVMQSERVTVGDLAAALLRLEPMTAGMCAARTDREVSVLPLLEASQAAAEQAIDDVPALVEALRSFHELIGQCVQNMSMQIVLGAIEAIWSSHEVAAASIATLHGNLPSQEERIASLRDHRAIVDAIRAGDEALTVRIATEHLAHAQSYTIPPSEESVPITASYLRNRATKRPDIAVRDERRKGRS